MRKWKCIDRNTYLSSAFSTIEQNDTPKDLVLSPVSRNIGISFRILLGVIVAPKGERRWLPTAETELLIPFVVWISFVLVESSINLLEHVDRDGVYGDCDQLDQGQLGRSGAGWSRLVTSQNLWANVSISKAMYQLRVNIHRS